MEDKKKRMRMANQRGGHIAEKPNKKPVKSTQKEKEFEKYLQKIEDPNYQGGSWDLSENPTALEKTKYEICQKILAYKQDNNLTTEELAERISLSPPETKEILLSHIHKFTLGRLNFCLTCLFPDAEHEIFREYQTIYLVPMLFISNISCKTDRSQQ